MDDSIFTANVMADVYETYSLEGTLSEKGQEIMHDLFGDVPEDNRATVYVAFVSILTERGIDYNPKDAKIGTVH